jgi:hypothetical protein
MLLECHQAPRSAPRLAKPKSQVTRIPHAACSLGLVYIDATRWEEKDELLRAMRMDVSDQSCHGSLTSHSALAFSLLACQPNASWEIDPIASINCTRIH